MILQTNYSYPYVQKGGNARSRLQSEFFSEMILFISTKNQQLLIVQLQLMRNKIKLADIFQRKDRAPKEQNKRVSFDESYFSCSLLHDGLNTSLIKVAATLKESGSPLDRLKCRWFIKSANDFREITEVSAPYYQPCLDDVGCSLQVQVEPYIEGLKYTGVTLLHESQVIKLDPHLQNRIEEQFHRAQSTLTIAARLDTIFSQQDIYYLLELPLDVKIGINRMHKTITIEHGKGELGNWKITQDYPQVQFTRKSFNSVLFHFNTDESLKMSFLGSFERDLFVLALRTCSAEATSESTSAESFESKSTESITLQDKPENAADNPEMISQKSQETHFVLRIEQLRKQLVSLKRQHAELLQNYSIERKIRATAEEQATALKRKIEEFTSEHSDCHDLKAKYKSSLQKNHFKQNQISILRKELKETKQELEATQKKLIELEESSAKMVETQLTSLLGKLNEEERLRREGEEQLQKCRQVLQNYENENNQLKKKLHSLASQQQHRQIEVPAPKAIEIVEQSADKIGWLQMKVANLQMLLKYRQGGNSAGGMQTLVNKLTEIVTEKELQLCQFRKINQQLLGQLKKRPPNVSI